MSSLLPSPQAGTGEQQHNWENSWSGRRCLCLLPALQDQTQPHVGGRRGQGKAFLSTLEWGGRKTTWISLPDEVSEALGHQKELHL